MKASCSGDRETLVWGEVAELLSNVKGVEAWHRAWPIGTDAWELVVMLLGIAARRGAGHTTQSHHQTTVVALYALCVVVARDVCPELLVAPLCDDVDHAAYGIAPIESRARAL